MDKLEAIVSAWAVEKILFMVSDNKTSEAGKYFLHCPGLVLDFFYNSHH